MTSAVPRRRGRSRAGAPPDRAGAGPRRSAGPGSGTSREHRGERLVGHAGQRHRPAAARSARATSTTASGDQAQPLRHAGIAAAEPLVDSARVTPGHNAVTATPVPRQRLGERLGQGRDVGLAGAVDARGPGRGQHQEAVDARDADDGAPAARASIPGSAARVRASTAPDVEVEVRAQVGGVGRRGRPAVSRSPRCPRPAGRPGRVVGRGAGGRRGRGRPRSARSATQHLGARAVRGAAARAASASSASRGRGRRARASSAVGGEARGEGRADPGLAPVTRAVAARRGRGALIAPRTSCCARRARTRRPRRRRGCRRGGRGGSGGRRRAVRSPGPAAGVRRRSRRRRARHPARPRPAGASCASSSATETSTRAWSSACTRSGSAPGVDGGQHPGVLGPQQRDVVADDVGRAGELGGQQRVRQRHRGDEGVAVADLAERVEPGVVGQRRRGQPQLEGDRQRRDTAHGRDDTGDLAGLLVVEDVGQAPTARPGHGTGGEVERPSGAALVHRAVAPAAGQHRVDVDELPALLLGPAAAVAAVSAGAGAVGEQQQRPAARGEHRDDEPEPGRHGASSVRRRRVPPSCSTSRRAGPIRNSRLPRKPLTKGVAGRG